MFLSPMFLYPMQSTLLYQFLFEADVREPVHLMVQTKTLVFDLGVMIWNVSIICLGKFLQEQQGRAEIERWMEIIAVNKNLSDVS